MTRFTTIARRSGQCALLTLSLALSACGPDESPGLGLVTPEQLHSELASKDFLMIDVHVPYAGTLPQTDTSIPYTETEQLVSYVSDDLARKVVLTCLTDHMSAIAGNELVKRGYTAIRHLDGGMQAWEAAGFPIER